jgi:hypothetical protein
VVVPGHAPYGERLWIHSQELGSLRGSEKFLCLGGGVGGRGSVGCWRPKLRPISGSSPSWSPCWDEGLTRRYVFDRRRRRSEPSPHPLPGGEGAQRARRAPHTGRTAAGFPLARE